MEMRGKKGPVACNPVNSMLVWLSPAPVHHSLSFLLSRSVCNVARWCVCVCGWREWEVCASRYRGLVLVSQKEETGPGCLCSCLCEGCLCLHGTGKGMALCLCWPGWLPVCVHVYVWHVCVRIDVSGIDAQPCYWLQLQRVMAANCLRGQICRFTGFGFP